MSRIMLHFMIVSKCKRLWAKVFASFDGKPFNLGTDRKDGARPRGQKKEELSIGE